MSTDVAVRASDNGVVEGFSESQIDLIKRTVAKGSSDEELRLFLYTAASRGLDPLLKQIHAVMRWDKKAGREVMAIQVGIDGYRLLADRTGLYAGNDDAVFHGWIIEGEGSGSSWAHPESASVTVWKLVAGVRCPFTATAYWSDFFPGDTQGFMWKRMPRVMLAKVCEAQALRKGFPAQLGGMYIPEEMQQAGPVLDQETRPELSDKAEVALTQGTPATDATWTRWQTATAEAAKVGIAFNVPPERITEVALIRRCQNIEKAIKERLQDDTHALEGAIADAQANEVTF